MTWLFGNHRWSWRFSCVFSGESGRWKCQKMLYLPGERNDWWTSLHGVESWPLRSGCHACVGISNNFPLTVHFLLLYKHCEGLHLIYAAGLWIFNAKWFVFYFTLKSLVLLNWYSVYSGESFLAPCVVISKIVNILLTISSFPGE